MTGIAINLATIGEVLWELFILAFLTQKIVEILKILVPEKWVTKLTPTVLSGIIGLGISAIVVFNTQIGVFSAIGFSWAIPPLDWLLTGILISGGSNVMNDIFNAIKTVSFKPEA